MPPENLKPLRSDDLEYFEEFGTKLLKERGYNVLSFKIQNGYCIVKVVHDEVRK